MDLSQIPDSVWLQFGALIIALVWTAWLTTTHRVERKEDREERREDRSSAKDERAALLQVVEKNTGAMSMNTDAINKMESTLSQVVLGRHK